MPGQWEFQVGPCRGVEMGDHLTIARDWAAGPVGLRRVYSISRCFCLSELHFKPSIKSRAPLFPLIPPFRARLHHAADHREPQLRLLFLAQANGG